MSSASSSARPSRRTVPLDPEAWRFVVPCLLLTAVPAWAGWPATAWCAGLLTFCVGAFFRDPNRPLPPGEHVAASPADGKITVVEEIEREGFPGGRCLRIGIFLSVLDVHVNRTPIAGKVVKTERVPGKFLNAMSKEAAAQNERQDIWFETEFGPMLVRQIAGLIARRIVCRAKVGDEFPRGERFGMIRFGSGTEIYLPLPATPLVKPGQYVRCGKTPLARLGEEESAE